MGHNFQMCLYSISINRKLILNFNSISKIFKVTFILEETPEKLRTNIDSIFRKFSHILLLQILEIIAFKNIPTVYQ